MLVVMLAIRLSSEIEARLERLAKRTGRTKTFYAREAILHHLEDLEDTYLAERRLEKTGKPCNADDSAGEVKREWGLSVAA